MPKRVVLVGHCGPDSTYLTMAVRSALKDAQVTAADSEAELDGELSAGASLLLLNRVLDYGFATNSGVELLQDLKQKYPNLKAMLVSNYADAQAAAVKAGALPGFGKRDIGSAKVKEMLQGAMAE